MLDNRICDLLEQELEDKPYINFAKYMSLALYHPIHGYYMQKTSPVGRDFITAPLISEVFSQSIVSWLRQNQFEHVLEIGAGQGELAKQILKQHKGIKQYSILERNSVPSKARLQQEPVVTFVNEVGAFNGAIIANELLDALPFRRFCWHNKLYEFVITNPVKVDLIPINEQTLPQDILDSAKQHQGPYIFEYQDYHPFFKQLKQFSGRMLLIDYGYDQDYWHPDRMLGTMMCYKEGRSIPFSLSQSGLMDITCAVNWTYVEKIAKQYGFYVKNKGNQSDFILAMECNTSDPSIMKLISQHEMGGFVKIFDFCK